MADFYNPYQFIPVTGKTNGRLTEATPFHKIKEGSTPVRHDLWSANRHSGRILCSIELKTPTVVGGTHTPSTEHQPANVEPYTLEGEAAIPGNSLRGMVGSVVETLSQSALRVLRDASYSVRKPVEPREILSAIGMVRRLPDQTGQSRYYLRPLCLGTVDLRTGGIAPKWVYAFQIDTLRNCLGAYVNGYMMRRKQLTYISGSFLYTHRPPSFHNQRQRFFYAKLPIGLENVKTAELTNPYPGLYLKNGRFVLGQMLEEIISEEDYRELLNQQTSDVERQRITRDYVRGIVSVLGIEGREGEIPETKRHEKFIPLPERRKLRQIPIADEALEAFKTIAKERFEATKDEDCRLPFLPKGYSYERFERNGFLPLDGDLVYFDLNEQQDGVYRVTELSYSAIWRKKIPGSVHGAFARIQKNLVPWGHPDRDALTPAETLLGVVTDRKLGDRPKSQNLASRVRFHDARALNPVQKLPPIVLKTLASPKPPAPCMYFRGARKGNLNLEQHSPNGRKIYLLHPEAQIQAQAWGTAHPDERPHLKMQCTPLAVGQTFFFHVDFDNLDEAELTLLKTALIPDPKFQHRLGLGKPLGLGAVQVGIVGIFWINRARRYSPEGIAESRYEAVSRQATHWPEGLDAIYPLEAKIFKETALPSRPLTENGRYVDERTLALLVQAGKPGTLDSALPVRYPFTKTQHPTEESEIFKWFVANEKAPVQGYKSLAVITPNRPLQGLERNRE
jgi:CRISPR-associated protein (TIGR03986 family)